MEGVSEGFPRVSGGFLPDFTLGLFTMNCVFCWVLLAQERQDWGFQTHPSVPIIKLEGCNPRERVSLWGGAGVKCRLPFSSRILTAFARRLVNAAGAAAAAAAATPAGARAGAGAGADDDQHDDDDNDDDDDDDHDYDS